MFEHRRSAVLTPAEFAARLARFAGGSLAIVFGSLALGAAGYHGLGGLPWIDALLNAAMILTGMGPVDHMQTDAAKLFSAGYALFSGVAFITMVGVLFAPVVHRFFHRFHLEVDEDAEDESP